MKINKGLEKQLAKEVFSLMVNDDAQRVDNRYIFYLEYTRKFPNELNEKLHSFVMNVYSLYQINNMEDASAVNSEQGESNGN